jgi:hypothetical protein
MENIDARKHSPQTQYGIRKQVIRLRKRDLPKKVVAEGLGVSIGRVSKIWQRYKKRGSNAIKLERRGCRTGVQRTLCSDQGSELCKALIDKTPDQFAGFLNSLHGAFPYLPER